MFHIQIQRTITKAGAKAPAIKSKKTMEVQIQDICQFATMKVQAAKNQDIRDNHGSNTIVLFTTGNYYRAYEESADALTQATGIYLDRRAGIRFAEFPKKAEDTYFARCVRAGYKLCIID